VGDPRRNSQSLRPPLDVAPIVVQPNLVSDEGGIVLLDQDFTKIEWPPSHVDPGGVRQTLDPHYRQVGMNAAVKEKEIELRFQSALPTPGLLNSAVR
jgi:hypothetical protein